MTRSIPPWKLRAVVAGMWAVQFAALGVVLVVGAVGVLNPWLLPALELAAEARGRCNRG